MLAAAAEKIACQLIVLLMGYNILVSGFLTAINHPDYSFVISICRSFVFLFASLVVMAALFGATGIWLASFVSEGMCLGVTWWFYQRWKKNEYRYGKDTA